MAKDELSHKIYLITFKQPKFVMEIGEIIYGESRATYPKLMGEKGAIKKCLNNGWIKGASVEPPDKKPLGFEKRDYYIANSDIILKHIENKINLDKVERRDILKILNSENFKKCIGDLSNFIDYPNQDIDAIEYITDMIGFLCAYIYMVKNYGNFFGKKIKKLLPSKKAAPNLHKLGMKDLDKCQEMMEERGFDKDKFLEENKILYNKLIPGSKTITKKIKGELVEHYIDLSKNFFVLQSQIIKKLSGMIPVHKHIFLNYMAGGFIYAENSNHLVLKKVIDIIKLKKRTRFPVR
jgi:hypothetical protein